jgi:hypothetical protein
MIANIILYVVLFILGLCAGALLHSWARSPRDS